MNMMHPQYGPEKVVLLFSENENISIKTWSDTAEKVE
jgi:hypothetical protein